VFVNKDDRFFSRNLHPFMVSVSKNLLEGNIIFGICKFHWDDYTPHQSTANIGFPLVLFSV